MGLIPACAGKTSRRSFKHFWMRAHPRVCGENAAVFDAVAGAAGSSPRVRGKPAPPPHGANKPGLIPACAGKTPSIIHAMTPAAAHPRVCGENDLWACQTVDWKGSSPRVRGKPSGAGDGHGGCRLIPACAGKTKTRNTKISGSPAHPRVCGENEKCTNRWLKHWGSSPRVRGKPRGRPADHSRGGLIPACAGKTGTRRKPWRRMRAHPRVCGENSRVAWA